MCATEISNFIKNLHSLVLPSSLWAVHVDPKEEFLAIVHINVNIEKISIDKAILITSENATLKASVSLNDEIVQIPSATSNIQTISDLNGLIYSLHEVKFCIYANAGFTKCTKYILSGDEASFCDNCAYEVFKNAEEEQIDIPVVEPLEQDEELKQEKDNFLCTVCGKTFTVSSALDEHMLTHASPSDKPFKCKICTKSFAKKYNLNVHIRVHSGERPYVCSTCGKTYSTRSNLSTHMNSTHCEQKRHHCELCDMTFVHPRVLRIHMRKHTGEKPYKCQICGKSFSKKVHVTIHTRTHTGEKPYTCETCGKAFTTTGNLNSHKKISNH